MTKHTNTQKAKRSNAGLKKTQNKEFLAEVKAYILDCIDHDGNEQEKFKHVMARFDGEFNHDYNKKRFPVLSDRFAEWLQGLALNFDYDNHAILELCKKWHEVGDLSEKTEDKLLSGWWKFLAVLTLRFAAKSQTK